MPAPSTGTPTANSTWRLDVDLDDSTFSGNFTQVRGMSNFVPGKNDTVTDTTDYDTDGWGADAVMQQKFQNTCTLRRNKYVGARDAGQEALLAAADSLTLRRVRWYERTVGGRAYEGYVLVQWADAGGDAAGIEEANVTLLGQGPRTEISNPWSATPVPVINAVQPSSGDTAGGDLVTITGSAFTGATAVTFDGVAADSFTVVSDAKIVAATPAGIAGAVDVVVTNGNGPSTTGVDAFTYA